MQLKIYTGLPQKTRDVYTLRLANLNASRPPWQHRGGLAEDWLVRSVVWITVGHPFEVPLSLLSIFPVPHSVTR